MYRVAIIGEELPGLSPALQQVGASLVAYSLQQALRIPGALNDAELAILRWAPGTQPALESHAFTGLIGALHLFGTKTSIEVGPYVASGVSACPQCLADPPQPAASPVSPLIAWAAALTTLQVLSLIQHGSTDLVGRSYCWRLSTPGLQERPWNRRAGCRVPGCISR